MTLASDRPNLEVYMLGLVDLEDAHRLQRRVVYDLGERGTACLILCEHPPTISVGRSGSRIHILPDDETLRSFGVRTHWVNRGGGCVLHLPGQLCSYLAISLERVGLNLKGYLDGLHQTVIDVLDEFDLQGSLRSDLPGVFLGPERVATVGIAVNRWIAYHGLTLNVGPYLEPFELILEEPGIGHWPLRQTSMEARRQRIAQMSKVRESLIRHVEAVFGLERQHVFTHHPLIRGKTLSHVYAPSPG
jgi:lipoyl(octanoyl) transferase